MEAIKQEGMAGLESLQAEIGTGTGPVMGTGSTAATAANEPKFNTQEQLETIMGPLFGVMFPAWGIQGQEIEALAEAYSKVIDKWFPGGINLGVELEALLITAMIFGPRLKMPRKIQPQSSPPQQPQEGADDE